MFGQEKCRFIFLVDAEKQYNILVRIVIVFNRQRIPILEFNSQLSNADNQLRILVLVEDTKENALKMCKRLEREIDIIAVHFFERQNNMYAK